MSGTPAYHGWTHRPKGKGGTDPIEFELPYITATNGATNQSVTATAELTFSSAQTNNGDIFKWDSGDPCGLLIYKEGLYEFFADVSVISGSIAVPRSIYSGLGLLSSGAGAAFGNENGQGMFAMGTGQGSSGVSEMVSGGPSKSRLLHVALRLIEFGLIAVNPYRAVVVLSHSGTNDYTVGNIASRLTVVRIGDLPSDAPAPA